MKLTLIAGLIAVAAFAGCKKSEEGGFSGKDTFKIAVPMTNTNVKQGETGLVKVSVDRGSEFRDAIKLEIRAPKGLTVDPESATVDPADKDGSVQLKITADKDAALGDGKVLVKGTPGHGAPRRF